MWLFDGGSIIVPSSVPGAGVPVITTGDDAYYGMVDGNELIGTDELISAINLSGGSVVDRDPVMWIKARLGNKLVFVPTRRLVGGINWRSIYAAGAVYGNDSAGSYPLPRPVLQNARVQIGDVIYRVRLLRGASNDPLNYTSNSGTSLMTYRENSEWDRIMVRLKNGVWGSMSDAELGVTTSLSGYQTWCQETSTNGNKVLRGVEIVENLYVRPGDDTSALSMYRGWRPVLEAIGE